MAKRIKSRIISKHDTTANWNAATGFIPLAGEIIIYTDHKTKVVNGETVYIPGVKIGSGNAYVQDLAFLGESEASSLLSHTGNSDIHVTAAQKQAWSNKLNVSDNAEADDEVLIFNRN